jgi:hypothetical protein
MHRNDPAGGLALRGGPSQRSVHDSAKARLERMAKTTAALDKRVAQASAPPRAPKPGDVHQREFDSLVKFMSGEIFAAGLKRSKETELIELVKSIAAAKERWGASLSRVESATDAEQTALRAHHENQLAGLEQEHRDATQLAGADHAAAVEQAARRARAEAEAEHAREAQQQRQEFNRQLAARDRDQAAALAKSRADHERQLAASAARHRQELAAAVQEKEVELQRRLESTSDR